MRTRTFLSVKYVSTSVAPVADLGKRETIARSRRARDDREISAGARRSRDLGERETIALCVMGCRKCVCEDSTAIYWPDLLTRLITAHPSPSPLSTPARTDRSSLLSIVDESGSNRYGPQNGSSIPMTRTTNRGLHQSRLVEPITLISRCRWR